MPQKLEMTCTAHPVSARNVKCKRVDEPKKNEAELSGPRMSEIGDPRNFLRSVYVTETATIIVAVLLIH